jgi:hypothetical protein
MTPQGTTPAAEPQASPFFQQRSATMPLTGQQHGSAQQQQPLGGLSPIPQAAVAPSPSYAPAALPGPGAFAPSPQPQRLSVVGPSGGGGVVLPPGAAAGLAGPRPNHESVDFTTLMAGRHSPDMFSGLSARIVTR